MKNLRILNPQAREKMGQVRHALFDFDGTLSLLREGWEGVMIPLMIECISPHVPVAPEIEQEVHAYVDRSTGTLTIRQMEWLAEAVRRHGLNPAPLDGPGYKIIYRERLLERVRGRVEAVAGGQADPACYRVPGAYEFLARLAARGVTLYMASGSDHVDVVREAELLGIAPFFGTHIYGALDASEAHDKERLVRRLLKENNLHGAQLAVFGDGPVEIQVAASSGAIGVGVASDEVNRMGWDMRKIERLTNAGADLLIPDFVDCDELADRLVGSDSFWGLGYCGAIYRPAVPQK